MHFLLYSSFLLFNKFQILLFLPAWSVREAMLMKGSGCSKCSGMTWSAAYYHIWSALCYILMVYVGMSMAPYTSGVHWRCKLSLCKYGCRNVSHLFICMWLMMYFKISLCKIAATLERKFRRDSLFYPDELDSLFSYFDTGAGSGPRSKYKERKCLCFWHALPPSSSRACALYQT